MKALMILLSLLGAGAAEAETAAPAPAAPSAYDPHLAFAPLDLPGPVNRYRSGDGSPGPDYWQNRADYVIEARLDPAAKTLSGSEVITYANNSPSNLTSLWLQLDQNNYRRDARVAAHRDGAAPTYTDGYVIEAVSVEQDGTTTAVSPLISDTRMQVRLPHPLKGGGGRLKLHVRYHYTVPGLFGGRTAWVDTPNGPIFDIAQWYPRMAVFDDVRGWDTQPFLFQEFYLEYGDFDYAVTVPAGMMVMGTGVLQNPGEVLSAAQRARLDQARASDATVMIRTPAEVAAAAAAPPAAGETTWRYHMDNTRDVAFSASRAFAWDAARINLPGGASALAMSVYPPESARLDAWDRSTEYLKDSVEHFSRRWSPYPYPTAVSIAGGVSAMEYPGIAFDGVTDNGKYLFWITAHEIGHTWFPMMVGFDERRDPWMDEGFNTFIDVYESDDFSNGVYGPKRDSEFAEAGGNPVDAILPVLADKDAPIILTRGDAIREKYRHPVSYFKSALGLILLREQILGPERFDPAFRKFIRDWTFKHPAPSDFFRAMESAGGEDLSWFWRGWYLNNWTLDLAVERVAYIDNDPAKGARVTVANLDRLVMPSSLEVRYADGKTLEMALPVETWIQKSSAVITLPGSGPIASVTVDPRHLLPDKDRANNVGAPGL